MGIQTQKKMIIRSTYTVISLVVASPRTNASVWDVTMGLKILSSLIWNNSNDFTRFFMLITLVKDQYNRTFNLHPEKWSEAYRVKSTQIFIGCHLRFFKVSFYPGFLQGGSLKKVGCHTYKSEKKSGAHPEKTLCRCNPKEISGSTL